MYLDTLDASQSYFPKEIEATYGIPALCEILMINVKEKIWEHLKIHASANVLNKIFSVDPVHDKLYAVFIQRFTMHLPTFPVSGHESGALIESLTMDSE